MAPPPTSRPAPPPEPPFLRTPHDLLEEIFLRLPTAADLARASTACATFCSVITGHAFLRLYRTLHPPPLIGFLHDPFSPAQPPHPSAVAARAFADFSFSCSSFLPATAGRNWSRINFFDGRALLAGAPVEEESGSNILLGSDTLPCDPVHRRYILLPAVPDDLKALVRRPDLFGLETFLAPGDDEEDPLSFRVMCLAQCRMHLLLIVFSSLNGQWRVLTNDQWSSRATLASFENSEPGLSDRQFVHGCFCWQLHFLDKLLLLDTHTMEFSDVDLPPDHRGMGRSVIVEASEGKLGMLTKWYDQDTENDPLWLTYSVLRNNQWHWEKDIPMPVKRAILVGVAGGYLLLHVLYTTPSQEDLKFGYFSVDLKTLQVELFARLSKAISAGHLYAGFPPSLSPPTI
ncbi:hypothetical protein VPH35_120465 [Triticum aestivum]